MSLAFLLRFFDKHNTPGLTGHQVHAIVKESATIRFTETLPEEEVWAQGKSPFSFVVYDANNPFKLTVDTLAEFFSDDDPSCTFVWLSCFAGAWPNWARLTAFFSVISTSGIS